MLQTRTTSSANNIIKTETIYCGVLRLRYVNVLARSFYQNALRSKLNNQHFMWKRLFNLHLIYYRLKFIWTNDSCNFFLCSTQSANDNCKLISLADRSWKSENVWFFRYSYSCNKFNELMNKNVVVFAIICDLKFLSIKELNWSRVESVFWIVC